MLLIQHLQQLCQQGGSGNVDSTADTATSAQHRTLNKMLMEQELRNPAFMRNGPFHT